MILTPAQTSLLYSRPHKTKLWLSIYRPTTLFSCQVTGSYSTGETELDYIGASGTWSNVYPNALCLVGTSRGNDDVSRIRSRSITGTYAILAENAIQWHNGGQYLTFVDYIDVEAVYPKIIKDPDNDESVIFYKDGDIPYSNQNSIYGSFANAGSHRAVFLETGTATLYWTATGTQNVADSAMTYSWFFDGGTPTGSAALTPGNIVYNTAGHYKTRLTVTAANGAVDTTYRYVSVYDRPENGANTPTLKWSLESFSGSRGEGGYTASIKVFENLGSIEPNALVVIFADDWYGSTNQSIGGNGQNNSKTVFVGYILKDTIRFNYKDGSAEFDVGSITEVMKQAEGFSVSCESKGAPATWFQLLGMNIKRALYHYLRWHSTVLNVTDFQYIGDNRSVQYFDSDRSSLYDAIQSFVSNGLVGDVVSDRQGKIWTEISETGYENPFTSLPTNMSIQKHDWINEPEISERRTAEVSFVEMGGIVYEGDETSGFQALLSNAPSVTPLYRGKSDGSKQGLILTGQSQLNQIAGNYLESKNHSVESASLSLAGNYRNFDIAPQELQYLIIDENDAPNGISLIGKRFKFQSMDWNYDSEKEYFYPDVSLVPVVTGSAGVTVLIPPSPPIDGYDYPSFDLPPLPDFDLLTPPTPEQMEKTLLVYEGNTGLLFTTNLDATEPTFQPMNGGVDSTKILYTDDFFMTPAGSVWRVNSDASGFNRELYYAPALGTLFTKIVSLTWLESQVGTSPQIYAIGYNPFKQEEVAFFAKGGSSSAFFIGNRTGFVKKATGVYANSMGGCYCFFSKNEWIISSGDFGSSIIVSRISADGGSILSSTGVGESLGVIALWNPNPYETKLYKTNSPSTTTVSVSTDNGKTWKTEDQITLPLVLGVTAPRGNRFFHPSWDSGKTFMGDYGTVNAGRTYDYGYTFTQITTLPSQARWNFILLGNPGTGGRWVAIGASYIYVSTNFGATWIRKDTYIPQYITPIPNFGLGFVPFTEDIS